jgi:predicted dehydrogenase
MTLRIGVISFAHMHANAFMYCFQQLDDMAEIVGIYDEDRERGREASDTYKTSFYSTCEELFDQHLDAVVISSENSTHRKYTELAANHGCHILCEKPISVSLVDAKAMIDVCQTNNVQLMIAFPCRYSTPILRARQLISEGRLGSVLALKGTNRGTLPGGWFLQKDLAGGGAIMDHTVHVIDVWRWLLGCEVVSVYAEGGCFFSNETGIDDTGVLMAEFANGVFATLDTSWSRPKESFPARSDVTMEIVAEGGSITLDAFRQHIDVYNNDTIKAEWVRWGDDIYLALCRMFLKSIQSKQTVPITGYDGFKAMEVALGAYRSLETGFPVSLPLSG